MKNKILPVVLIFTFTPVMAAALQPLDERELSAVSGQDGIVLYMESPAMGFTADSLHLEFTPSPDPGSLYWSSSVPGQPGLQMVDVDANGNVGGSAHVISTVDAGSDGTDAFLSYRLEIHGEEDFSGGPRRGRLSLGELSLGPSETKAFGSMALDGHGVLHLINRKGFFDASGNQAFLFGELENGRIYYRQVAVDAPEANRAYLIMDDLHARWEIAQGTFGINSEGIRMASDTIKVALDADLFFKSGGIDFTPGGRGLQHFGWLGNLKDAQLLWRPMGASTQPGQTPGVLNLNSRWNFESQASAGNYADEFRWRLGETGGTGFPANGDTRVMFEVADWATWGDHAYGHDFPLISLDVINGARIGSTAHQLCWGAGGKAASCSGQGREQVNLRPGYLGAATNEKGLSLLVRDGYLQAYSRRINYIEQQWAGGIGGSYGIRKLHPSHEYYDPDVTASIDWGLIYTFADIDATVYLYPGGNPGDNSRGIMGDIVVMSQTFEDDATQLAQGFNWDTGSHLMIADTNMNGNNTPGTETRDAMGIGLIGTSFLLMADDARLWLKPQSNPSDYYTGGVDLFSPRARFAINTNFGGGVLPDDNGSYGVGPRFVRGSIIKGNLEGALNYRLSPSSPTPVAMPDGTLARNYLGYSMGLRLMSLTDTAGTEGFGRSTDGSFVSLAEPSRALVDIRLAQLSGNLLVEEGKIDVRATEEDPDTNKRPALVISHQLRMGTDATAELSSRLPGVSTTVNPELRIGALKLGSSTLGQVVVPSARAYAAIKLEPKAFVTPSQMPGLP